MNSSLSRWLDAVCKLDQECLLFPRPSSLLPSSVKIAGQLSSCFQLQQAVFSISFQPKTVTEPLPLDQLLLPNCSFRWRLLHASQLCVREVWMLLYCHGP
ncbi:hypothetical protein VIGAN_03150400 [Vigna angularis var. angularis]|uniref:Uncharacterized protein n=1 Tax=Vigna angularis var. angularis TaxID=157739 RepID=A0A0S3RMA6_PHAAN|nr:hypothetical protein VIGAN_03150400 [Vigna angularis var. angularis]